MKTILLYLVDVFVIGYLFMTVSIFPCVLLGVNVVYLGKVYLIYSALMLIYVLIKIYIEKQPLKLKNYHDNRHRN